MSPLALYGDGQSALELAQVIASPAQRERLLSLIRDAHGDPTAAIDPRPQLPTVLPDPAAGAAVTNPAGAENNTEQP